MGKAHLVLKDGVVFEGVSLGREGEAVGEVVFNTSMTGYQEILTDPSYKGQIVTMTYTQMGNYGINPEDIESTGGPPPGGLLSGGPPPGGLLSGGPKVEGFIVKECLDFPSNWRSKMGLDDYLKEYGIVGISGIDTRALTRRLRDHGAQMGIISTEEGPKALFEKIRIHPGIGGIDLVKDVTSKRPYMWTEPLWGAQPPEEARPAGRGSAPPLNPSLSKGGKRGGKVVVYDFGVKLNILRSLVSAGFEVAVVPAATPVEEVLDMKPDGIILSNGPGDPEAVSYGIENVRKLIFGKPARGRAPSMTPPVFGICLGHQILGLAMGGRTYKLKFGHHGGNHPVKDLETGRVEITSQNHNYCVDLKSLRGKAVLTHESLYDGTEEGMRHAELPVFSVQHHPEAGPGPNDSRHLFKRFKEVIEKHG